MSFSNWIPRSAEKLPQQEEPRASRERTQICWSTIAYNRIKSPSCSSIERQINAYSEHECNKYKPASLSWRFRFFTKGALASLFQSTEAAGQPELPTRIHWGPGPRIGNFILDSASREKKERRHCSRRGEENEKKLRRRFFIMGSWIPDLGLNRLFLIVSARLECHRIKNSTKKERRGPKRLDINNRNGELEPHPSKVWCIFVLFVTTPTLRQGKP